MRQTLPYGTQPRSSRARVVKRALIGLLLVALSVACARISCQQAYFFPEKSVQRYLEEIPIVTVRINSYNDPPGLRVLQAIVHRVGNANEMVTFRTPTRRDLRSGKHLLVQAIGPYRLKSEGSMGWREYFDFGTAGECSNLLPFPLRDAEDVINKHDEIVAFLAQMPSSSTHATANGELVKLLVFADRP